MKITLVTQEPMIDRTVRIMLADPRLNIVFSNDFSRLSEGHKAELRELLLVELTDAFCDGLTALEVAVARGIPLIAMTRQPEYARSLGIEEANILTIPFHRRDLLERLAQLGTARRKAAVLKVGDLMLDRVRETAFIKDQPLALTPKEMKVLDVIVANAGKPVTKRYLMETLYGEKSDQDPKIVDVFVCKIRTKIKKLTGGDQMIETIWGRGFTLPSSGAMVSFAEVAESARHEAA